MLPSLRPILQNISFRNQGLQDILKTSNTAKEVLEVETLKSGHLYNTCLTALLKNGKRRVQFYNRVDISTFLTGLDLSRKTLVEIIEYLNTEHDCDFTEDDLTKSRTHLVASETSLGYIGQVGLGGDTPIDKVYTDASPFPLSNAEYISVFGSQLNPFTDPRFTVLALPTTLLSITGVNLGQTDRIYTGVSLLTKQVNNLLASNTPLDKVIMKINGSLNGEPFNTSVTLQQFKDRVEDMNEIGDRYYGFVLSPSVFPYRYTESVEIDLSTDEYPLEPIIISTTLELLSTPPGPIDPTDPVDPPPITPENPGDLEDFDFAVIRYIWEEAGGKDMDTRTYLKNPERQISTVGWSRLPNDLTYLQWGGDNTGAGVEAILLNVKSIAEAFPDTPVITVSCNAFWYSSVASGNFVIQFEMYKGGTMVKNGFDWINQGGVKTQTLKVDCNTMVRQSENIDGQEVVLLNYTPETMSGQLIKL